MSDTVVNYFLITFGFAVKIIFSLFAAFLKSPMDSKMTAFVTSVTSLNYSDSSFITTNWHHLKKCNTSKKENKGNRKKTSGFDSRKILQNESYEQSGPFIMRNTSLHEAKPTDMQKSLSGPVAHLQFTNGRNKMVNRTFTRDENKIIKKDPEPKRTFSNSTVNLSKCKPFDEGYAPQIRESKNCPSNLNSNLLTNGLNHNLSKLSQKDFQSINDKPTSQPVVLKRSKGKEHGTYMQESTISTQWSQQFQGDNSVIQDKALPNSPNLEWAHVLQKPSVKRDDSDISIGSTRPKYLVHHNGEILLPCPKLADLMIDDSMADHMNTLNVTSCCHKEVTEDRYQLMDSINLDDFGVKKAATPSLNLGDYVKDNSSASSNETHYSASSVEMDLDMNGHHTNILVEKVDSKPFLVCKGNIYESQHVIDALSFHKKKHRRFKWMKLFKKDCHQVNSKEG
ncbi:hypothetical protein Bpfe_027006 [Biomphalaria pfeifferi]|uniref:Uncharacterized protein n=1 Tax=Biomphalaria pfeifferi TaxID=112525 RepID=A0AAD8AW50_BIOPF|nr:hypothetical protein Bpfe_027006 [Biomphalaria pfeifferi]